MNIASHSSSDGWLKTVADALRTDGVAVVRGVLDQEFLSITRAAMYEVREEIRKEIGNRRLSAAGELGVLRLMMSYHRHFTRFLEIPEVVKVLDALLSPTAVLHTQNGFILPALSKSETPTVFQNQFHMDFPRHLNGYIASVNVFFPITDFHAKSGATIFVRGTHQRAARPTEQEIGSAEAIETPAGSMIVFDSTLWHASGYNVSGSDRLGINHQFTRSFFKQQIDYVRALGSAYLETLPARTQQLLGWYTRVPASLDEYYQPAEKRLYRSGQG